MKYYLAHKLREYLCEHILHFYTMVMVSFPSPSKLYRTKCMVVSKTAEDFVIVNLNNLNSTQ